MFFRWFEHNQIYHPSPTHAASAGSLGRFEDVYLGEKPRLHGWFFPAKAKSPRDQIAVLICHGNGGNISHRLNTTEVLLGLGLNVFIFDYRGYGLSTGTPSEDGTYDDAQSAYQWLKQKGFADRNIIALGESLGGGIASELAVREKLGGLILQSTFTCMPDIGSEVFPWLPVRWICSIRYDTCKKLPKIRIPLCIMHSRSDRLIGFHHAEKNFALANEPKLFCELKGDHNNTVDIGRGEFITGVEKLLALIQPVPSIK